MPNFNSNIYANMIADPRVLVESSVLGGKVRLASCFYTIAGTETDADVVRLFQMPSHYRFHNLLWWSANPGTALTVDVGLYDEAGTTAVDSDLYGSSILRSSGSTGGSSVDEAAALGLRAWDALGLTSDPGILYTVALTLTTATTLTASVVIALLAQMSED